MREASKRLTQRYVSDPNTIVLCVVSATKMLQVKVPPTPHLPLPPTPPTPFCWQTDQALGLVTDMRAGPRTLLVLTMCDLVVDKQWDARVFKPLLGESDALAHCGLRGCFGVVNRSLDDSGVDVDLLAHAETREERWLEVLLARVRRGNEDSHRRVVSHLSIGNLVKEVDAIFHERASWMCGEHFASNLYRCFLPQTSATFGSPLP